MNCRRLVNLLSAYMDGELSGAEMLDIRRHLSECAECNEEYESMRVLKHTLSSLRMMQPKSGFAESIIIALDEVNVSFLQRMLNRIVALTGNKIRPLTGAVALSLVLFAFVSVWFVGNNQSMVQTPNVVASSPFASTSDVFISSASLDNPYSVSSEPLVLASGPRGFVEMPASFTEYAK